MRSRHGPAQVDPVVEATEEQALREHRLAHEPCSRARCLRGFLWQGVFAVWALFLTACRHDAICVPEDEIPYDGLDQDCDGVDLTDRDGDGFDAVEAGGDDCDDLDASAYPGAPDTPYDGVDQDCDGADLTDVDGDGHDAVEAGGNDCDDQDPTAWPGAPDTPYDGVD